jgi:hypothetical protein
LSDPRGRGRSLLLAGALALIVATAACANESDETPPQSGNPPTTPPPDETTTTEAGAASGEGEGGELIVFSTEGNNLNAYETQSPFEKQTVVTNAEDDPDGTNINGQICFFPDEPSRFIAGEDTGQPQRTPGWGIFEVEGSTVGELSVSQVGRLVPTYQEDQDGPENYGCGVLSDGRVVTSDIGNQVDGPANGQLIIWFPPFDTDEVAFCKLATDLPTAGGIVVDRDDDDTIYVTSARAPDAGVLRFRGPYPTSDDADGSCGRTDATDAPVADAVRRDAFITADERAPTPNALVAAPESNDDGGFYVTSAFSGSIIQYDDEGSYVGTLLAPPEGETFGDDPFSTGTPLGIAVADDGTTFFADLGLGFGDDGVGPLPEAGSLRVLAPGSDEPEVMDEGLDYPDGVGLYNSSAAGGGPDRSPL